MSGANDFVQVIDWEFQFLARLWNQIVMQNIFLSVMVIISLVAMVIAIKDNIRQ